MRKTKLLLSLGVATLAGLSLASCSKDSADIEVGILQYTTHTALDKATNGFKEALTKKAEEAGKTIKFVYKNPEQDQASMLTMANQLVRDCDLVLGNATPAATQLISSRQTEGKLDLPILFTSVTDPVSAGLVSAMSGSAHTENVTGTSDLNPVSAQMDLIKNFDSTVEKIGFIYNVSETNSEVQVDSCKEYLKSKYPSIEIEEKNVNEQGQISATVTSLIKEDKDHKACDAIYIPTDNLMASNMTTITNVTNPAKVPVFTGESGMVDSGGTMTISISYYELGYTTGEQAAQILFDGKSASSIDVVTQTDASKMEFAYNASAMTQMNLTFTDEFKTKYSIK